MESDLTHPPETSPARHLGSEGQWSQGVRCLSPAERLTGGMASCGGDSLVGTVKPCISRAHLTGVSAFWTSQGREISRRSWGSDIKVQQLLLPHTGLRNSHLFIKERDF